MPNSTERFQYLFSRYAANQCTEAEMQEFFDQLRNLDPEKVHPYMDIFYENIPAGTATEKIDWNDLYARITQEQAIAAPVRKLSTLQRIAVAAAILITVTATIWHFLPDQKPAVPQLVRAEPADIPPGRDQAILTLADGKQVILDSTANGNIAEQGGIRILKQANGELSYLQQNGQPLSTGLLNTLSTPRGGQYRLTLPDGSKVWLNAASSIRYPAAFGNKERRVEITGEAYFEVAKFRNLPFRVNTPSGEIQVLGTHFNVNAYANEPAETTTLLEGKISLSTTGNQQSLIIQPGQQAQYIQPAAQAPDFLENEIKVQNVDTGPVIAWTNNNFVFSNTSLGAAMRQIERWYDVEVILKGNIANEAIMASLSRDIPISRVMHKLSLTGHLHFTINGKKITVTR